MNQYCLVCGETRCARVDAECDTPCVSAALVLGSVPNGTILTQEVFRKMLTVRTEYKGLADQAAFAQQRESAMARSVYGSAEEWLNASIRAAGIDPDGPHIPLPKRETARTISAPQHDYISALYRPYVSPV